MPASATASTTPAWTAGGETRRPIAPYTIRQASTSSVRPLAWALRISARPRPYVIDPDAPRAASRAAASDSASAAASVSMWPASDSSASDEASTPATISTTMNARISASAHFSERRSASRCTCE